MTITIKIIHESVEIRCRVSLSHQYVLYRAPFKGTTEDFGIFFGTGFHKPPTLGIFRNSQRSLQIGLINNTSSVLRHV